MVFKYQKKVEADPEKEIKAEAERVLAGTRETVEALDKSLEEIKGKGSTDAKNAVIALHIADGTLEWLPREAVTKMRLQWVQGHISQKVMTEVGERIAYEMIAMRDAAEKNFYPQDGGVRFPNAVCGWCEQRGHCLGNKKLVEEMLVQIKTQDEPDWLAELEEEAA